MNFLPTVVGFEEKVRQDWVGVPNQRRALIPAPAQIRDSWHDKITTVMDDYKPFSHDFKVYDSIRNHVPIIEACYMKYKMLVGMPEFDFGKNKQAGDIAAEFVERVKVNQYDSGLYQWIIALIDSALHYGNGYAELVPTRAMNDVAYLKNVSSKTIRFIKDETGNLVLGQVDKFGISAIPFNQQDFIYHLAFWKRDGHPQGYSLLYPLPFVTSIFEYIQVSLKKQWIRIGDPTFAFIIETDKDMKSQGEFESSLRAIEQLTTEWKTVQKARLKGEAADVVGAMPPGSTMVMKTIGEGMVLPDLEVSMRTVIEQIVAQTGFPLFFFGFHWGGNYNLTTHQNDMIVNQINFIRNCIDPLIDKVFRQLFLLKGLQNVEYDWEWPDVNLRDESEQAKAALDNANAQKSGIDTRIAALQIGMLTPEAFVDWLVEEGIENERYVKLMPKAKMAEMFLKRWTMAKALGREAN